MYIVKNIVLYLWIFKKILFLLLYCIIWKWDFVVNYILLCKKEDVLKMILCLIVIILMSELEVCDNGDIWY